MRELVQRVVLQTRNAWRFRWWGMLVAWVVSVIGFVWVGVQKDIYEASTRIFVDTSSVLRPLLGEQIVDSDIGTRLVRVRQALLGREYLQQVAIDNNLDTLAVTAVEKEAVLDNLVKTVDISATSPSTDDNYRRQNSSTIFTIRYRHPDPKTAEGVVSSFKDILIEDTLGANRTGAATAEDFFSREIAFYENLLAQAEQARLDFLQENSDRLPGSETGIQTRIQREQEVIDDLRRQLTLAASSRVELERQLSGESALTTSSGALGFGEPPAGSLDAQIRNITARRDELSLRYTPSHPEVIRAQESLAQLEAQKAERLRAVGITNPDQELSRVGTNQVFEAIRIQINEVDVQMAQLRVDIAERERRLRELSGRINDVLGVEARAAELDRDIAYYEAKRRELIEARERQRLSGEAASSDQVEFNILNPPQASQLPVAPKRPALLIGVFVAALGTGAAVCWLLAQLKPVFSTTSVLREITGLPVLGTVGHITVSGAVRRRQVLSVVAFGGALLSLVLIFGIGVVFEISGPGIRSVLGGV